MDEPYHRSITTQALGGLFSLHALQALIAANLGLDSLLGQIAHDEYHFDNNAFEASYAFIQARRAEVRPALEAGDAPAAWLAFGQLTHVVQDFYAHTNYVALWLARSPNGAEQAPAGIDPLDSELLASPELRSGRLYYPLEIFSFVPGIRRFVIPLLPRDSHAWMNMDSPERPNYAYAETAAIQRTRHEFTQLTAGWPKVLLEMFTDFQEV
jgi:hypothetical protein